MLPRKNRIKRKKDFKIIFKKARSRKNTLFVFKTTKNNLNLNRFGFVVSQKVSKKATIRNKIRRRLIEAIKTEKESIKPGTDTVIIALPGIEKKNFSEIKKEIKKELTNV
jgi:ribonuclease P protein component